MKVDEFEKKINYKFKNKSLIDLAFTHSSFKNKINKNYERLEFLGDRVLSLVISEDLFLKYSNENEGALSKRLSDLVSKQKLLEVANEISIKEMLKIDQFEKRNLKLKKNISILSDVCEALIGAIYLDSNLENAKKFISKYWKKKISKNILPPQDPKSLLQEVAQKKGLNLPKYILKNKEGPPHNPRFEVEVFLKGIRKFSAIAKTIKIAEINAAKKMVDYIFKNKLL
jgi:ribonuclease-3